MLLIVAVITLVILFAYNTIKGSLKEMTAPEVFLVFVLSLALGVCVDFFTMVNTYDEYVKSEIVTEVVETREIVALEDVNSEEGDFFLGCGSVGTESYYAYYYKGEYGTTPDKVKLYDDFCPVYINEITGKEKPHIDEYRTTQKNILVEEPGYKSILLRMFCNEYDIGDDLGSLWGSPSISEEEDRYEIFVPKNTIKENYNIDMQ